VAKSEQIEIHGVVEEVLPNAMFRVKTEMNTLVTAHISGRLRQNKIQILMGDKVRMEMSPYDLTKARISYRM
jgi:translation initiation factor IF-1